MRLKLTSGLLATAFGAFVSTAGAAPIDLPSATDVDLKYTGVTVENTSLPGGATFGNSLETTGPNAGSYAETTWGAGQLNQIIDLSSNTLWQKGQNGQNVYFMLYGIADKSASPDGLGGFRLNNIGCTDASEGCDGKIHIDFYLNPTGGNFLSTTNPITTADRTGFSTMNKVTNGSLLMSWVLTPGGSPNDPLATLFQDVVKLTLPTTGLGDFLANCVAGPECSLFDQAAIADPSTGAIANFFGQFTLNNSIGVNGWEGLISDPVLTETPEPATLGLFGAGLLGLGALRNRKKK